LTTTSNTTQGVTIITNLTKLRVKGKPLTT